jgi:hypothetical protein
MAYPHLGDIVPLYVPGGHDLPGTGGGPGGINPATYGSAPTAYDALHALQQAANSPATNLPPGSVQALLANAGVQPSPIYQRNPWIPSPILPDSMLPPALKRIQPDRGPFWTANRHDQQMLKEAYVWKWVAEHGGLKSCCRIPELGAPIWDEPPWQVMPSQGQVIRVMQALPIGSVSGGPPFNGVDTILWSYRVPIGYDGAFTNFVAQAPGVQGFDEFSGDIVWRLKIGTRYAKNLGTVTNTYGSFQNNFVIPGISIRVISGQTVQAIANIPVGSPVAGGVVAAGVFGWIYPRR